MASYTKHEAQEWAWDALKGQWTTLMTPLPQKTKLMKPGYDGTYAT